MISPSYTYNSYRSPAFANPKATFSPAFPNSFPNYYNSPYYAQNTRRPQPAFSPLAYVPYYPPRPSITWVPVLRKGPRPAAQAKAQSFFPATAPNPFAPVNKAKLPLSELLPIETSAQARFIENKVIAAEEQIIAEEKAPSLVDTVKGNPLNEAAEEISLEEEIETKELVEPVKDFTEVKASHLLLKVHDQSESDAVLGVISDLREAIVSGQYSFSEAAREFSEGPSGKNGGDLGYFEKGMMVKPFEKVAFDSDVEIGSVSEPVLTDFGWHLLQIQDRR